MDWLWSVKGYEIIISSWLNILSFTETRLRVAIIEEKKSQAPILDFFSSNANSAFFPLQQTVWPKDPERIPNITIH